MKLGKHLPSQEFCEETFIQGVSCHGFPVCSQGLWLSQLLKECDSHMGCPPKMRWVFCLWAHVVAAVEHTGRKYKPPQIKTSAELRYWSQHGHRLDSIIISAVTCLKMSILLMSSVRSISNAVLWAAWPLVLLWLIRWMYFKTGLTTILRLRSYTEQLSKLIFLFVCF